MSLIFDIGFNNGDDTEYYLSEGHTVVAVEASPLLCEKGREKFSREIKEGRLALLNVGVWSERTTLPFFVNESNHGWSSFLPQWGHQGGKFHTVEIPCFTLSDLISQHGMPWYLKIDVEGADHAIIHSMKEFPQFFSCELGHASDTLEQLKAFGYRKFMLLNQTTFTDSLPILSDDPARVLRKVSVLCPPLKNLIHVKRTFWDKPYNWKFGGYSTGPTPDKVRGQWLPYEPIRSHIERTFARYSNLGIENEFWYDLHARL